MKIGHSLSALAMLSACGSQPPARTENKATATTIRNEYHERLAALGAGQRSGTLRQAIRSSGESCDGVEASAFQQDYENLKMWTASCKSTRYAVFLAANGDVQVRPCRQAIALKLPPCADPATKSAKAAS